MKTRLPFFLLLALVLGTRATAHVGSPDIFFEGHAGPYRLFVTIGMPQVIPGVAAIKIRCPSADVREVRVVPMRLTGPGSSFAPAADVAERSKDDPQFFTSSLWLMEGGSLGLRIQADGARGKGEVSVPVPSVAQRVLPMPRTLGGVLFILMLFLTIGLVSVAGAAAREAELEPGEVPTEAHARRGRRVIAAAAVVVIGLIYLGYRWWNSEATAYASNVYRPPQLAASFEPGGRLLLGLELRPPAIRFFSRGLFPGAPRLDDLMPDHNHLMHLFLIRLPEMERFWHLHPEQTEPGVFVQDMPCVPPGRYQIFADIVHQNGFPETVTAEVDLPDVRGKALSGDDSEAAAAPLSQARKDSTVSQFPDGGRMIWERESSLQGGPPSAKVSTSFRFRVEDENGNPVKDMEPYMGMPGHAEFVRSDLQVFAHVHPAGSVSMAALELAQTSLLPERASPNDRLHDSMAGMAMPSEVLPPEVSFPYGFPQPGTYRIFVQIKRAGRIETGVFDAEVH